MVFIDPATGKIRKPDPSEIGKLTAPASPTPKAQAPEPVLLQGPDGAVGAKLGPETMTYMVVTTAPDGKLATDCVTGEKAANERVTAASPKQETHPPNAPHPQAAQDTQNAKIPR